MRDYRGFTLIETIVTIVVLSVIAMSVMHVMVEGFKVWWTNKSLIGIRADGRFTFARVSNETRQAEEVSLISASEVEIKSDIYNKGIPQTIRYKLEGGELKREEDGQVVIMCGDVSSVAFGWNSPLLTLDMTLSKQGDSLTMRGEVEARCVP